MKLKGEKGGSLKKELRSGKASEKWKLSTTTKTQNGNNERLLFYRHSTFFWLFTPRTHTRFHPPTHTHKHKHTHWHTHKHRNIPYRSLRCLLPFVRVIGGKEKLGGKLCCRVLAATTVSESWTIAMTAIFLTLWAFILFKNFLGGGWK